MVVWQSASGLDALAIVEVDMGTNPGASLRGIGEGWQATMKVPWGKLCVAVLVGTAEKE